MCLDGTDHLVLDLMHEEGDMVRINTAPCSTKYTRYLPACERRVTLDGFSSVQRIVHPSLAPRTDNDSEALN